MKIRISAKKLEEILDDVALKGKYYNGTTGKNGQLSNFAYVECWEHQELLQISNADHSTVCRINIDNIGILKAGTVVFDIDKTIKYLKPFGDTEVVLEVTDYITITSETSTAKIPKVLEHPAMTMIAVIKDFSIPTEGMPTFRKTTFESKVSVLVEDLSVAIKACDAVNNAKYKFETGNNTFVISSERNNLDKFETTVDTIENIGEPATVEFTGQFLKFMKNSVSVYMKDDAPVLFVSRNRVLMKAPYLER
jgi:hypothetical protein|tara:strand:+ start:8877 stop:9629 length:753 start_codon:yes stop_codon:yes gene_type:complete